MATKTKKASKKVNTVRRGPRELSPESLKEVVAMGRARKSGSSFETLGAEYGMAPQSIIRRLGDFVYKVRKGIQPVNASQRSLVETLVKENLISKKYATHGRAEYRA